MFSAPLGLLLAKVHDPRLRAYTGHGWMHADTCYMFGRGMLFPEEAELAATARAYPWSAHLHQSLLSRVLDLPPVTSYHSLHRQRMAYCFQEAINTNDRLPMMQFVIHHFTTNLSYPTRKTPFHLDTTFLDSMSSLYEDIISFLRINYKVVNQIMMI